MLPSAVASLSCCLPISVSAVSLAELDSVLCNLDFGKNVAIIIDILYHTGVL